MGQIVVIRDYPDEDTLFVLNVKNYDQRFGLVVACVRETYEDETNEEALEDLILAAIEEAGYEYDFTGFDEFFV